MNYFAPTIEIVKLDVEDIILASSTTGGGNTGKPGGMGGGNETGWVSVDGGYIGGSTGVTVFDGTNGTSTGADFNTGDIFGNY